MIGKEFDTQHGLTNLIVLPAVLRYNLPSLEEKRHQMAHALNIKNKTSDGFIKEIEPSLTDLTYLNL